MPSSAQKVSQDVNGRSNPNWSSGGSSSAGSSMTDMIDKYAAMIKANAAENNAWSAEQAQINRDWQERMSDTAHQREVADLKKAGLNPVLSVNGGQGAATTSGATASTDTSVNSAIAGILGSILQSQVSLENQRLSAQTNLAVAEKYNAMSKYTAELNSQTQLSTANISAATSRWIAQLQATTSISNTQAQVAASKINARVAAAAQRYGYELSSWTSQQVAKINGDVNKELKQMGIDAEWNVLQDTQRHDVETNPEKWLSQQGIELLEKYMPRDFAGNPVLDNSRGGGFNSARGASFGR